MIMLSREEARELLTEILSRPEFAGEQDLAARLIERFLGWLAWLFESGAIYMLAVLVVAALVVLIFLYLRRYLAPPDKGQARVAGDGGGYTAGRALERSCEAALQKGYREALRYLLLSALLYLEEEGALEYHLSTTNGEYLRRLRSAASAARGVCRFKGFSSAWARSCRRRPAA